MNESSDITSGVYRIKNLLNNDVYIGSTTEKFKKRWRLHTSMLNNQRHHSPILQRAWNKYGGGNFIFEIVELCPRNLCLNREQYYLDLLHPKYNICKVAGSPYGRIVSEKTKKLLSKKLSGKNNPFYGKTHTLESRNLMSKNIKGKTKGLLVGEKNPMYKKDHSVVNKRKMSDASNHFWNSEEGKLMKEKRKIEKLGKPNPYFTARGTKHPKFNPKIYTFLNVITDEKFLGTTYDFRKKYNFCSEIYNVVNKKYKQYKGWEVYEI